MALENLTAKRATMGTAVGAYISAPTVVNRDQAILDIDAYAKEAGQAVIDNPGLPMDDFFSDPSVMTAARREMIRSILKPPPPVPASAYIDPPGTIFTLGDTEYLIVNRSMMLAATNTPDGTDKIINYNSKDYTFGKSAQTVFTGQVVDMQEMFLNAGTFNSDISHWDTSNVTNMYRMFKSATQYNQSMATWDVSNVTTMKEMFMSARDFNGDISSWNVSGVTDMQYMFHNAANFNQDISAWNVSSVTNMEYMFVAKAFNQPLNTWNVSGCLRMSGMFNGATAFNQPLDQWDTSNVTTMAAMFYNATSFSQDLSGWNVSSVIARSSFSDLSAMSANQLPVW